MTRTKLTLFIFALFFAQTASAQVLISEVQISPIGERFIELYNSDSTPVDLTGWYIQRKTSSTFGSLVSSTQMKGKTIKAGGYFLISRNQLSNSDLVIGDLTLSTSNAIRIRNSKGDDIDQVEWTTIPDGKSYQKISGSGWGVAIPTPGVQNANTVSVETQTSNTNSAIAENTNTTTATQTTLTYPVDPQIYTDAGPATL